MIKRRYNICVMTNNSGSHNYHSFELFTKGLLPSSRKEICQAIEEYLGKDCNNYVIISMSRY